MMTTTWSNRTLGFEMKKVAPLLALLMMLCGLGIPAMAQGTNPSDPTTNVEATPTPTPTPTPQPSITLTSDKTAVCAGGGSSAIHKATITATVKDKNGNVVPNASVSFGASNVNPNDTPDEIGSLSSVSFNSSGNSVVTFTSSQVIGASNKITASYSDADGSASDSVDIDMGDTSGEITPPDRTDMIADGQDNVTLKWPLKYGSDAIRDHSVEWKMVDIFDENGVEVTNEAEYPDYGHISSSAPDADGTYTAIYTTGTKGGTVSFEVSDNSVYVKDSSATGSSPSGFGAQSVSASATPTPKPKLNKKKIYKSANPKSILRYGGGLILSTIEANEDWPYARPIGMAARLGYTDNSVSDDQILLDVCLQIKGGVLYAFLDLAMFADGRKGIVKPQGGSLQNAEWADRRYLTLAMLKRSINARPPYFFSGASLDTYAYDVETSDKVRLLNQLRVRARIANNEFSSPVVVSEKRSLIGGTSLNMLREVFVKCTDGSTRGVKSLLSISAIPNDLYLQGAGEWGNNAVTGGKVGDDKIAHRTASRIGPLLVTYEDYLLNNIVPPPFYSEVILSIQDNRFHFEDIVSNQRSNVVSNFHNKETGATWPTHHIYLYSHLTKLYTETAVRPQIDSPFHGFIPSQ